MEQVEGQLNGARGGTIHFRYWRPGGEPKAVIVVAHGAAEHGGRYKGFAEYFTAAGYVVAALDHDGHGKSDGKRCCLRSFDDYVEDLTTLQRRITLDFPDSPRVLMGHSLGGLIACNTLLEQQDKYIACVLSGAAIMTDLEPPPYQAFLVRLLSRILPNLGVLKLSADGVSRDPAVVQDYVNDPLNHTGKLSVRLIAEMFHAMDTVHERAGEITLPVLILHGGEDVMTAPQGSVFLHDNVSSSEKKLHVYPGLYHEIFNEPERYEIYAEVESWLDGVVARSAA